MVKGVLWWWVGRVHSPLDPGQVSSSADPQVPGLFPRADSYARVWVPGTFSSVFRVVTGWALKCGLNQ